LVVVLLVAEAGLGGEPGEIAGGNGGVLEHLRDHRPPSFCRAFAAPPAAALPGNAPVHYRPGAVCQLRPPPLSPRSLPRGGPASPVARLPMPGQTRTTLSAPARGAAPAATAVAAHDGFEPLAALFACILPGLGHWFLGERARAGVIAAGILSLFFGGLL